MSATGTDKAELRREKGRLRSTRWRRARGIGPRPPARKPWLAEGISRSTWYRRGNRLRAGRKAGALLAASERAKGAPGNQHTGKLDHSDNPSSPKTLAALRRAEAFAALLNAEIEEAARWQQIGAAIIEEMEASARSSPWIWKRRSPRKQRRGKSESQSPKNLFLQICGDGGTASPASARRRRLARPG